MIATIPIKGRPEGVDITPDGKQVYVTGAELGVAVISVASDTLEGFIGVAASSFGKFISSGVQEPPPPPPNITPAPIVQGWGLLLLVVCLMLLARAEMKKRR